jgi:hypothetical protein
MSKVRIGDDPGAIRILDPALYYLAMGGFFLDSIIGSIMKSIRRESRANTAENWPIVDAKVSNFSAPKVGDQGRPSLLYTYEVNGDTHYGSATGFDIGDPPHTGFNIGDPPAPVNGAAMDATTNLRVRYDPADPLSSRILNRDNPTLPFEIDHASV